METRQWTTVDKALWGAGPWQAEPDKLQWEDHPTGLPCLVKRNHFGALCGYVGVPEGHPWYRQDYSEIDLPYGVHGGLTYASHCQEGDDESSTICHLPAPGEPDNVWWVGFDCAHAGDVSPANEALLRTIGFQDTWGISYAYRDLAYVREECRSLAQQVLEAA